LVVEIIDIHGSPNIGVYTLTTNKFTIIPLKLSRYKTRKIQECLNVEMVATTMGRTMLTGVLAVANSNGIVIPNYVSDKELQPLKKFDVNFERIESKKNAFGNLILVNDKGGIVDQDLMKDKETMKCVRDTLDVEITQGTIAGLNYVGSLAVATNKGVLAHPMIEEDERKLLREVLKVPVDEGTVNLGIPFISSGLMANDNGALAGNVTTGPEIFIIGNALDVV
jgi:translation initiation factor 6